MLKIILTASIAAVLTLTLSCSSGGGGGDPSGSNSKTEVHTLIDKDDEQFQYAEVTTYDVCNSGVFNTGSTIFEYTVSYLIENNIMIWQYERTNYDTDTLHLKGKSNELTGTWTRTKNIATSCEPKDNDWATCKRGYNITKAVFTATTVAITRDICITDELQDGQLWDDGDAGWKMKAIDCDTYEVYKETKKVTVKENEKGREFSYNGNSCKWSEPTKAQKQAACKEAGDNHGEEDEYRYYWNILHKDFYDCLKEKMPKGFWTQD